MGTQTTSILPIKQGLSKEILKLVFILWNKIINIIWRRNTFRQMGL